MKKLLTSLTILALISPMPLTAVDAQAADPGMTETQAKTEASVTISGYDQIFSIGGAGKVEFEDIKLKFGEERLAANALKSANTTQLTVTDTRYITDGYKVTATLSGDGDNPFPEGTELILVASDDPSPESYDEGDDYGHGSAPKHGDIPFTLTEGASSVPVLTANRGDDTPFAGAGKWSIEYEAKTLEIPYKKAKFEPGTKLTGIITWSLGNASE